MRFALACFAFLIAALCFVLVIASSASAVYRHFNGSLQRIFEAEGVGIGTLIGGIAFYAIIGTVALVLGLALLGKSRRP